MNEVTTINRTQPEYSAAGQKALQRQPQLYINGEWVDSSGGATIDVEDPSSGKVISKFVEATDKDELEKAAKELSDRPHRRTASAIGHKILVMEQPRQHSEPRNDARTYVRNWAAQDGGAYGADGCRKTDEREPCRNHRVAPLNPSPHP